MKPWKISWIQHIRHPGRQPQCARAHCQDRAHRWHLCGDAESKRPCESQTVSGRTYGEDPRVPSVRFLSFWDEVWKFWKSQIFPSCKKSESTIVDIVVKSGETAGIQLQPQTIPSPSALRGVDHLCNRCLGLLGGLHHRAARPQLVLHLRRCGTSYGS